MERKMSARHEVQFTYPSPLACHPLAHLGNRRFFVLDPHAQLPAELPIAIALAMCFPHVDFRSSVPAKNTGAV